MHELGRRGSRPEGSARPNCYNHCAAQGDVFGAQGYVLSPFRQAIVTVIIPTWRRADLLRVCLQSLAEQREQRFRTVVVSNAAGEQATAATRDFAATHDCRLIEFAENRGFATAVNAGLAAADTELLAVLNDDVRLDADWLTTMTGWMEAHPETGFCAGAIYSGDGLRIDNLGDALARGAAAWRLGHGAAAEQLGSDSPRRLLAASWTALMLRRSVMERVGNLDEQFVSYLEDMDFALRCVRANVQGALLPQAVCWHQGSASSGGPGARFVFRQMTRNRKLLLAKAIPREMRAECRPEINIASWLWLAMAVRQGKLGAWLAGQTDYWRALPRAMRGRLEWDAEALARLRQWLQDGEAAIYADQCSGQRGRPDAFWRYYFALAGKPGGVSAQSAQAEAISESSTRHS